MIRLPEPVKFSNVIKPISLACKSKNNVDVIAIGNGLIHPKHDGMPWILQYTYMKTLPKVKCFPYLPIVAFRDGIICAHGDDKQSICDGDSGGSLMEARSRKLIGITSFSSTFFGCNGFPQGNVFNAFFLNAIFKSIQLLYVLSLQRSHTYLSIYHGLKRLQMAKSNVNNLE